MAFKTFLRRAATLGHLLLLSRAIVLCSASLLFASSTSLAAPQPGAFPSQGDFSRRPSITAKKILVLDLKPAQSLDLKESDGEPLYRGLEAIAGVSRAVLHELSRDRQFTVLGRDQLGTDPSIALTMAEAIELGRRVGADAILGGTLEQFTVDEAVRSGGRFRDFDTSGTQLTAEVVLSTYLVSTRDGRILETMVGEGKVRRTHSGKWSSGSLDGAARDRYRPILNQATEKAVAQAMANLSAQASSIPSLENKSQERPRLVMLDFQIAGRQDYDRNGLSSFLNRREQDSQRRSISQMLVNQLIETDQFTVVYSSPKGWTAEGEVNMAEAIEIGRQLGGDLVVTGEIVGLRQSLEAQPSRLPAVPVDTLGNDSPAVSGELNLAERDALAAPLSVEAYMTGVADSPEGRIQVSIQVNSFVIDTRNGQLIERLQMEGKAEEILPAGLSVSLRERLYEGLLEEAAADAIGQTALAIAEAQRF